MNRTQVALTYFATCLIWGTTWLAIRYNARTLGPLLGVGMRFTMAGLALYAVAFATGRLRAPKELPWKAIAVIAAFLIVINYGLIYVAEVKLDSGMVSVLYGTLPLLTIIVSRVIDRTRVPRRVLAGAVIALFGLGMISLEKQVHGAPLYALAVFAAAGACAFSNVYTKRHAHESPFVLLPPAMVGAGVLLTAIGLREPVDWSSALTPISLGALLYLALFGSCLAFLLYLRLLRELPAWTVGMTALVVPLVALTIGWALGGEILDARRIAGALLVVSGVATTMMPHPE